MKVVTLSEYFKSVEPGESQTTRVKKALQEIYKNKVEDVIQDRKTGDTFFIIRGQEGVRDMARGRKKKVEKKEVKLPEEKLNDIDPNHVEKAKS